MIRTLDDTDLQILRILQEEGRITNLELSQRIGLSPAPTLERVRKLEQSNIISSYHAELDPESIGLSIPVIVGIKMKTQKPSVLKEFSSYVRLLPNVLDCYELLAEYDFLLYVVHKDTSSLQDFLEEHITDQDNVESVKVMTVLTVSKRTNNLPL